MSSTDVRDLNELVRSHNQIILKIKEEIGKIIVGQNALIDRLLIALLANGHILLEGLPGLAKTLTIKTLASCIQCGFQRIQFTPDLLPADLTGTSIYNPKDGSFSVKKGPIFTNFVLADEINRAPAKVQSALLQVMEEHQVTIGKETFKTDEPFIVLATQNPIEQEGTYPLPEAQTDRFMLKVRISYPSRDDEKEIIFRMNSGRLSHTLNPIGSASDLIEAKKVINEIYIDEKVIDYILDITTATRNPQKFNLDIQHLLAFGASPRASLALVNCAKAHAFLNGRGFVTPHDVKSLAHDVLRHRIGISFEAEAEEINSDMIIDQILDSLLVP